MTAYHDRLTAGAYAPLSDGQEEEPVTTRTPRRSTRAETPAPPAPEPAPEPDDDGEE